MHGKVLQRDKAGSPGPVTIASHQSKCAHVFHETNCVYTSSSSKALTGYRNRSSLASSVAIFGNDRQKNLPKINGIVYTIDRYALFRQLETCSATF